MLTHDQVRNHLANAGLGDAILVSRYKDDSMDLPRTHAHVFFPDWHLITPEDAQHFPNCRFTLDTEIETMMNSVSSLKSAHPDEVIVWHLGDILDEWRALRNRGPEVEVDAIVDHYAKVLNVLKFSAPLGVKAKMLAGNHDFVLHQLDGWRLPRFRVIENPIPNGGSLLVIHGDVFSAIEGAPDGIQKFFVQLAKGHKSGTNDLGANDGLFVSRVNAAVGKGDFPIAPGSPELGTVAPVASNGFEAQNVVDGDSGSPARLMMFFNSARRLAVKMKEIDLDIRALVVGHTHVGRIVRADRGDGVPFVLMDCGAWVGKCRLPGEQQSIKNAQIGVLIGNEFCLYQIGRIPV